jgi:16S rRNA (cytidine1402-2'-O)-methyltransferase
MSGTLFLVATPIGNLEDITLRALRVLREVDLIAAEDTRRTAKLLAHYTITTPTLSFHAHNTRNRLPQLLARLEGGQSVALVSDAGTPGISDPGLELIQACWDKAVQVDPIPGPSAPLAAAIASGFPLDPFTVFGFAPSRPKDRTAWLSQLSRFTDTLTFFETPHRVAQTLSALPQYFGGRPILIARELTKRHQDLQRYNDVGQISRPPEPRGEFTLVIGPIQAGARDGPAAGDQAFYDEFCRMTSVVGVSRRGAIASVAKKYGRSAKHVYAVVERLKKSEA